MSKFTIVDFLKDAFEKSKAKIADSYNLDEFLKNLKVLESSVPDKTASLWEKVKWVKEFCKTMADMKFINSVANIVKSIISIVKKEVRTIWSGSSLKQKIKLIIIIPVVIAGIIIGNIGIAAMGTAIKVPVLFVIIFILFAVQGLTGVVDIIQFLIKFVGGLKNKVKWGYGKNNGPDVWGQLSSCYCLCSEGKNQSPINIAEAVKAKLPEISFNYQPTTLKLLNNGNTIEIQYDEGSWIEIEGIKYTLQQFHFHSPGEHTVENKVFDMEMHLVHKNNEGVIAVIGVMINKGDENKIFSPVWKTLPINAGEIRNISDESINVDDMLPISRFSYRYEGSLTTPPCSEGVKWLVLTTPIEMSETQIKKFRAIIHKNNRPIQPINGRKLLVDK